MGKKLKELVGVIKRRPIMSVVVMIVLLTASGLGAWTFFMQSSYTANVVSEGVVIGISEDFSNCGEMDTTFQTAECVTEALVQNSNGVRDTSIVIVLTKDDEIGDTCTDYEDDCSVVTVYNDTGDITEINDGDDIILQEGNTSIISTLTCVENSCEQDITYEIQLSDLGERVDHEIPVINISNTGTYPAGTIVALGFATDDWEVQNVSVTLLGGSELGSNYYDGFGFDSATPVWLEASYDSDTEEWEYSFDANPSNPDNVHITARATDISSKNSEDATETILVMD